MFWRCLQRRWRRCPLSCRSLCWWCAPLSPGWKYLRWKCFSSSMASRFAGSAPGNQALQDQWELCAAIQSLPGPQPAADWPDAPQRSYEWQWMASYMSASPSRLPSVASRPSTAPWIPWSHNLRSWSRAATVAHSTGMSRSRVSWSDTPPSQSHHLRYSKQALCPSSTFWSLRYCFHFRPFRQRYSTGSLDDDDDDCHLYSYPNQFCTPCAYCSATTLYSSSFVGSTAISSWVFVVVNPLVEFSCTWQLCLPSSTVAFAILASICC